MQVECAELSPRKKEANEEEPPEKAGRLAAVTEGVW